MKSMDQPGLQLVCAGVLLQVAVTRAILGLDMAVLNLDLKLADLNRELEFVKAMEEFNDLKDLPLHILRLAKQRGFSDFQIARSIYKNEFLICSLLIPCPLYCLISFAKSILAF